MKIFDIVTKIYEKEVTLWCETYDHDMKYEFHLPLTIFYLLVDDNDTFESKWNKMTYFKMLGWFWNKYKMKNQING